MFRIQFKHFCRFQADFGLSQQWTSDANGLRGICGTDEYIAPEIIAGKPYGKVRPQVSLACADARLMIEHSLRRHYWPS